LQETWQFLFFRGFEESDIYSMSSADVALQEKGSVTWV